MLVIRHFWKITPSYAAIVLFNRLTILIHFFIISLILSRSNVIHPLLVLQVPFHRLLNPLFKLQARFPAQFLLQLSRIDGVAHVVTLAVRYVCYQVHVFSFLASQQTVHGLDYYLDDVDVLPFVETANVVGLGHFPLMEDKVDGTGVVYHVQPVAHVLALAVYR